MSTSPVPAGHRPVSMAEFAAEIVRHYGMLGRSPVTIGQVRCLLDQFADLAGVRTTADLDDEAIRRFIDRQPTDQSSHSYYYKLSTLRAVFNHALGLSLIDRAPAFPFIPQPSERGVRPSYRRLSPEEFARVWARLESQAEQSWEDYRLYALAATIVFAGLLKSEALPLPWEDCDLERDLIRVRRREKRWRTPGSSLVRIPATLTMILGPWRRQADSEWVFPNKARTNYWNEGTPKPVEELSRVGHEAGVRGFTFAALHRYASQHGPSVRPTSLPSATITRPTRSARPRPATLAEATRLMAHLLRGSASWEGHRLYALTSVVLFTSLRVGTVQGLLVEDFDPESRTLRVYGRTIPHFLAPPADRILAEWLGREDLGGSPWMFPGTLLIGPWHGGRPGHKPREMLQAAAHAVGIEHVSFESLRRLWNQEAGRIVLGEEYRTLRPPARIFDGPSPRRPGPLPKSGISRRRQVPAGYDRARRVGPMTSGKGVAPTVVSPGAI